LSWFGGVKTVRSFTSGRLGAEIENSAKTTDAAIAAATASFQADGGGSVVGASGSSMRSIDGSSAAAACIAARTRSANDSATGSGS
jgi:hypothetical protein